MSALVIGSSPHIGAIFETLTHSGFDAVYYQRAAGRVDDACLRVDGKPDLLILMKEAVDEMDMEKIFRKAMRLDIPVVLW